MRIPLKDLWNNNSALGVIGGLVSQYLGLFAFEIIGDIITGLIAGSLGVYTGLIGWVIGGGAGIINLIIGGIGWVIGGGAGIINFVVSIILQIAGLLGFG